MGDKRKLEVITISSDDDDEDDVPLKLLATTSPLTTANGLKSYSVQPCEFCDEVFLNKYDMLVHNAKHIIIPLLKQSSHQCRECLFCFISRKELKHHMKHTHKMKLDTSEDKKIKTKHANEDAETPKLKLKDFTINVVDVKFMKADFMNTKDNHKSEDAKESKHENVDVEKPKLKLKDFTINVVDVKLMKEDGMTNKDDHKNEDLIECNTIRSRLRFEDDITDCIEFVDASAGLITDLTKDCTVNMNLFDKPWVEAEADVPIVFKDNPAVAEVSMSKTMLEDGDLLTPRTYLNDTHDGATSTHYDELVKPGMFRCKRCQELFATRFQLIQHDMSHIKIRKPRPILCEFCERYISNSRYKFKQHLVTHSPDLWNHKQRMHTPCNKCGLKYFNYRKHMENYHELVYCHLCYKGFDSDAERLDHIREHLMETKCMQCDLVSTAIEIEEHQRQCHRVSSVSTIKICETCSLFVKSKQNMQYVFLQNISEIGTRLTCDRCNKKFFELKLVRRLHKAGQREGGEREKKKSLSNADRLKNIQQRLKMINKLSRF